MEFTVSPYMQGYNAYCDGLAVDACPYKFSDTQVYEWEKWLDGYRDAQFDLSLI